MSEIDDKLLKLAEKFHPDDIEWRVMRAQPWGQNIRVQVYPYVTARAIHERLDLVVGPANWCNTPQSAITVAKTNNGKEIVSVQVGISIRIGGEWVTKYNVCEPTDIEAAKGAFSGAEKRAGEEWGIGRYLWYLGEMDAEVTKLEQIRNSGWTFGKLSEKYGSDKYWWKPPRLPAWALPPGEEVPVTKTDLDDLKSHWRKKFGRGEKNRSVLQEQFAQLVTSMFGSCPVNHESGWTQEMIAQVRKRIDDTKDPSGPSSDIPFD